MSDRMKPILGALVVGYVINFFGVGYFFGPIIANDAPAGPLAPGWLSLLIATVLFILLFDRVAQAIGHPFQAAMVIAVSQILLVDVYYVLNGTRGIAAAGASATVLLVGWSLIALAYGKLAGTTASTAAVG